MSHPPPFSSDAIRHFVSQTSTHQFNASLAQFSIEELAKSFLLLQEEAVKHTKEKSVLLFEYIDASKQLQTLGNHLSLQEFLVILNFLIEHPSFQKRVSDLFIGLRPQVFCNGLNFFQAPHLGMFKEEGLLEPLQYHLTQFYHEGESLIQNIDLQAHQFEDRLLTVAPQDLTSENLEDYLSQINSYRNQLLDYLERLSVALSMAWNTERIDLIEKLSRINEILQHQLIRFIGHPSSGALSPTGLYLSLENTLSKIYSSLSNEDAATEGLSRLDIWHLKDYWELGLLPHIQQLHELDLDPVKSQAGQRTAQHQQLFSQVQQQLEKLEIGTVGALKRELICSKPLLKAYINNHYKLLDTRT